MEDRYIALVLAFFFPVGLMAQTEINALYNHSDQTIQLVPDIHVIEAGEKYQLKIHNINPVYIRDHIQIQSFRYVSETPEILEPILPGIPGSNVFDHFDIRPSGQREFFLKSLHFFNQLELVRSESDDLYSRTRFKPDTTLAAHKLESIFSKFETNELQEILSQIGYFREYIIAAQSIYKNNLKKVTLLTPDADIVIREYARLTRMTDKLKEIDHTRLLNFIVLSTNTNDVLLSEEYTGEKDVTEIKLALFDRYIGDTLYSGKLVFHTEQNWAFGFSTGLFFTNLYEKDFYVIEGRFESFEVREENRFRGDISIGGLAHFTYKFKPHLRIGPTLGASISPLDGHIRYLAGISGFIGKEQIVGISLGVALGLSEELSGAVPGDEDGRYLPAGENKIPVYTKPKIGFFVGCTYNFTRTKSP